MPGPRDALISFSWKDQVGERFSNALGRLGQDGAKVVMVRALNHEGAKAATAVRRALRDEAGLGKAGFARSLVKEQRANYSRMEFALKADGDETNLIKFGARQTKKGVSAAPWGKRRLFAHAFIGNAGSARLVFVRKGAKRIPIRGMFGPNIARELSKPYAADRFFVGMSNLPTRVGHEIERFVLDAASR